jgi:hypothetical protein
MVSIREKVLAEILAERDRQFNLPGSEFDQHHSMNDWVAISAQYLTRSVDRKHTSIDQSDQRRSLIKAAAVVLAAIEHLDQKNTVVQPRAVGPVPNILDALKNTLDGWAGSGSLAPSRTAIEDFIVVSKVFGKSYRMPEIEVDTETGDIDLIWAAANYRRTFTMIFNGNGKVIGVLTCLDGKIQHDPWSLCVRDGVSILDRLNDSAVKELLEDRSVDLSSM